MKILHILDHSLPLHSGYTFRTRAILQEQLKLGWQTFQVTSAKHSKPGPDPETCDGLTFYRSKATPPWLARLPVLGQMAISHCLCNRLDELIPLLKPDLLHAHSPALNGLAALRAGRKHGLPVVYECRAFWEDAAVDHGSTTENSLRYRLTHALETYVFRHADQVTTICQGLRDDIITRGIAADKVTVIANAVDSDQFTVQGGPDSALFQELNLEDRIVLGFIGSFYAYEGLSLLLSALPEIIKSRPDVRLLLVGGGPQDQALRQQCRALNLENHVIFTGRVPHQRVADYYRTIDLLIYPRLSMRLTELVTPLKPLEAMAQGRMLLASNVGGHRELIRDQVTGFLFPAGDRSALAKAVFEVLDARERWPTIQKEARAFIEQERSWPKSVAAYQAVYRNILDRCG